MDVNWERVKQLFDSALEREPAQRSAFLAEACGGDEPLRQEVESLLAAYQDVASATVRALEERSATATDKDPILGHRIGTYQVVKRIGEGGMAAVYLAFRADDQYRKKVAIKLVPLAMATRELVQRFRNERQTLAALEHPNIVRLFDGGTTEDGRPYLVMEYVEGTPITEYADTHRLSVNERLQLFRAVCSAVSYAHQRLIIHRDLKPSNILVTADGTPKLLDFGIAKLLNLESSAQTLLVTQADQRLMTLEYASPEQVRGQPVTTATDVYSLGVMLYELLTGHRPYRQEDHTLHEIERVICEVEPERPSTVVTSVVTVLSPEGTTQTRLTPEFVSQTREGRPEKLRRRLLGDVDNIVLKALRKEPQRRYASAEQFSEDVRRHLAGLPVIARPDTVKYRVSKFVLRHKAGVAATAALALTLVAGMAATIWQKHQANLAKTLAERRFDDVRKLATMYLFQFEAAIRNLPGSTPARKLVVDKALESLSRLAQEAGNDLSLEAELATAFERVGDIQWNRYYSNLGDLSGALASQRQALAIRQALLAARPGDKQVRSNLGRSYLLLGDLIVAGGDLTQALEMYRKSLEIRQQLAAEQPEDERIRSALALSYQRVGDTLADYPLYANPRDATGALENFLKMQAIQEELAVQRPDDVSAHHDVAIGYEKLAGIHKLRGDLPGALELFRKELTAFEEDSARQPANSKFRRDLAVGYGNVGTTLVAMGDTQAGLQHYREMLTIREDLAALDRQDAKAHEDLTKALQVLSSLSARAGEASAARTYTVRLLNELKTWADRAAHTADDLNAYAWELLTCKVADLSRPAVALQYARRAVEMTSAQDPNLLDTMALAYFRTGDRDRAIETEQKALALAQAPGLRSQLESALKSFKLAPPQTVDSRDPIQ